MEGSSCCGHHKVLISDDLSVDVHDYRLAPEGVRAQIQQKFHGLTQS